MLGLQPPLGFPVVLASMISVGRCNFEWVDLRLVMLSTAVLMWPHVAACNLGVRKEEAWSSQARTGQGANPPGTCDSYMCHLHRAGAHWTPRMGGLYAPQATVEMGNIGVDAICLTVTVTCAFCTALVHTDYPGKLRQGQLHVPLAPAWCKRHM